MKKELLDPVLVALNALIADELGSESPSRYLNVMRLSHYANKLRQLSIGRVKDMRNPERMLGAGMGPLPMMGGPNPLDLDEQNDMDGNFMDGVGGGLLGVNRPLGWLGGMPNDQPDAVREMIMMLPKMVEDMKPKKPPPDPGDRAADLLELVEVRKQFTALGRDVTVIDEKIDEATHQLKETRYAADEPVRPDHPENVRTVLPRGYPPNLNDFEVVRGDDAEGHRAGEGGPARAGEAGGEEGMVELKLGQ